MVTEPRPEEANFLSGLTVLRESGGASPTGLEEQINRRGDGQGGWRVSDAAERNDWRAVARWEQFCHGPNGPAIFP